MNEKCIIEILIEAFKDAKEALIERARPFDICIFIQVYITELYEGNEQKIMLGYFNTFFKPKNFGIFYVYFFNPELNKYKKVFIENIPRKKRSQCYWFPLEIEYNIDRLKVCDKAIEMLNKRLEKL